VEQEFISHPFGDLVQQHLARKNGLSKRKLAEGISVDPSVVTRMCQGKGLSRERIVDVIDWLHKKEALSQLVEANQLLGAAGLVGLHQDVPKEAALLRVLEPEPKPTEQVVSAEATPRSTQRKPRWQMIVSEIAVLLMLGAGLFLWAPWRVPPPPSPQIIDNAAELITLLDKANIKLAGSGPESVKRVQGYMETDTTYRELARNCLRLLQGKRLIDEVYLDVINGDYKKSFGVLPNEPLPFDKFNDLDKLKDAILKQWKGRYPNSAAESFDEIVEPLGP